MIACGEGYEVEFKRSPSSLAMEMVAFANSSGGIIFIGIDDSGAVFPAKMTNRLEAQIVDEGANCDPPIHPAVQKWGDIVKVVVPEGKDKPYQCKEGFFIRSGSTSQKLKRDQILKFAIAETKFYFDRTEIRQCPVAANFSREAFEQFSTQTGIKLDETNTHLLRNLKVLTENDSVPSFNNAGILMFSSKQEQLLPQSKITCVLFGTDERYQVADRKDLCAPLALMIDQSLQYIRRNVRIAYRITEKGTREERWEYPHEAVREAITNAVMHRDYYEMGSVTQIDIFPGRMEFTNPGGPLRGLTEETFGKLSFQRNPLIADLLYRSGYGEKIGTGIDRMREAMRREGLPPPEFVLNEKFFKVIFYSRPVFVRAHADNADLEDKILLQLRIESSLSAREIASAFNISTDTALRALAKLIKKGKVTRVGRARAARYALKRA